MREAGRDAGSESRRSLEREGAGPDTRTVCDGDAGAGVRTGAGERDADRRATGGSRAETARAAETSQRVEGSRRAEGARGRDAVARFQLACTRLWWSGPRKGGTWSLDSLAEVPATAREVDAARALIDMAEAGEHGVLRHLLRPDPASASGSWTVACYRIGDLVPDSLRDFADPVGAVAALRGCGDPDHLAAELVASTADGLCWVALVRAGTQVRFQPFGAQSVLSRPGRHALSGGERAAVEGATARWAQVLAWWSTSQASSGHQGELRTGTPAGELAPAGRVPVERAEVERAEVERAEVERAEALIPRLLEATPPDGASLVEVSATLHELAGTVATVAAAVARLERKIDEVSSRLAALEPAATAARALSTARAGRADSPARAARAGRAGRAVRGGAARIGPPGRSVGEGWAPSAAATMPAAPTMPEPTPADERPEGSAHRWWAPKHRTLRWRGGGVGVGDPLGDPAGELL